MRSMLDVRPPSCRDGRRYIAHANVIGHDDENVRFLLLSIHLENCDEHPQTNNPGHTSFSHSHSFKISALRLRAICNSSFSYLVREIQSPLSSPWVSVTTLQPLGLNAFSEFATSAVFWPKSFSYTTPLSSMTKVITPELRYSPGRASMAKPRVILPSTRKRSEERRVGKESRSRWSP